MESENFNLALEGAHTRPLHKRRSSLDHVTAEDIIQETPIEESKSNTEQQNSSFARRRAHRMTWPIAKLTIRTEPRWKKGIALTHDLFNGLRSDRKAKSLISTPNVIKSASKLLDSDSKELSDKPKLMRDRKFKRKATGSLIYESLSRPIFEKMSSESWVTDYLKSSVKVITPHELKRPYDSDHSTVASLKSLDQGPESTAQSLNDLALDGEQLSALSKTSSLKVRRSILKVPKSKEELSPLLAGLSVSEGVHDTKKVKFMWNL